MTTENNICYYSKGTKHELCSHQNWCIFNPKRIKLEETINKLTKILKKAEKQYNQQLINGDELIFTDEDLESIKKAMDELNQEFYAISSKMYAQAGGQQGAEGFDPNNMGGANADAGTAHDDNVVDADFEVKDDK